MKGKNPMNGSSARKLCREVVWPVLLGVTVLALALACATGPVKKGASVKTFVEPSLQSGAVKSIAILPVRNVRLQPDELREVNRAITDGFRKQNPRLKVSGAVESVTLLNEANLADRYSEFLRNYTQSAIPDVKTLRDIGKALSSDAVLQGEVFSIAQNDGGTGFFGKTSLSIRYVLLSTENGGILWEATGTAFKLSEKPAQPAPTLYEVIQMAQEKILTALPTLAQ